MSFGWSASDIVIAVKFVHKVGVALKDSGGTSSDFQETLTFLQTLSTTLQHIAAIQNVGNDPELAGNLKGHCDHLRVSLDAFLSDIQPRFGEYLGRERKWYKLQAASKKVQWAVSLSKNAKEFRDQIQGSMAAISANMLQQTLQIVTRLPSDVQEKVAHTIDTRFEATLKPVRTFIQDQTTALKISQSTSTDLITGNISKLGLEGSTALSKQATSIQKLQEMQLGHQSTLDVVLTCMQSLIALRPLATAVEEQSTAVSKSQATSMDIITRTVSQSCRRNTTALNKQTSEIQDLQSTIINRFDSMSSLINILHTANTGSPAMPEQHSTRELQIAARNLAASIWQILWHVQRLIRELVLLLMPYLLVFYQSSIHPLLLFGDYFRFEDALGRTSRLACLEFQQWDVFNRFLRNSFHGLPGLSYVLRQKFQVMNGYNSVPISAYTWATAIQPNCKITMAMLMDSATIKPGKCANPTCLGRLVLTEKIWYKACPNCGKHMHEFSSLSWSSTSRYKRRLSIEIAPKVNENGEMGMENDIQEGATNPAEPEDVSKFKRLAWQADSPIKPISFFKAAICRTNECTEYPIGDNLHCSRHTCMLENCKEESQPMEDKIRQDSQNLLLFCRRHNRTMSPGNAVDENPHREHDKQQQVEGEKYDRDQNNTGRQEEEGARRLHADGYRFQGQVDNSHPSGLGDLERLEAARLATAPHQLHRGMWDFGPLGGRRGAISEQGGRW
ncbi:hypothetical protein IFR05_003539 [Cadophora sp. M221]|nr:hypothetical protein IFR05_003539 [Cadophora sp. M221]